VFVTALSLSLSLRCRGFQEGVEVFSGKPAAASFLADEKNAMSIETE